MKELFDIPEQLSPRLAWIKKHKLTTHYSANLSADGDEPWAAWVGDMCDAMEDDELATGNTEDEALTNWAKRHGVRLWNEEAL